MRIYDIIEKKRDAKEMTEEEINSFVSAYTSGEIEDFYASALLMAIYLNGMNERETAALTKAICNSGDKVDLSAFAGETVDKHSTGGVGDKTTLIVAPIAASLGCKIAKMSGRGLGHTGGTVDKLESIKGYKTILEKDEFLQQVEKIGICVIGQSGNLAPADKKLYALRDLTATVDNISLIASSIMGKKLALGADSIVLDVKYGSGAFMKTKNDAQKLAYEMVEAGKNCGKKMTAIITNMDVPLGEYVGNRHEVFECVEVLRDSKEGDLKNLCIEIASNMVALCNNLPYDEAKKQVLNALESGSAYEKFKQWIKFQGGDMDFLLGRDFLNSAYSFSLVSRQSGYIFKTDTEKIGKTACVLGAGRTELGGKIDFSAGIKISKKTGDHVNKGDVLATFYSSSISDFTEAENMYLSALEFSEEKPTTEPLIYKILK